MRPFGCPVTILNTIDHLGKFDGKADEGFFIGYSINSKAFRVFNSRTRIVKENLHVQFSENIPNIAGSRPNWLFDIDALINLKSSPDTGFKPSGDDEKKVTEESGKEDGDSSKDGESYDQEKEDNVNRTNTVNAASTNEVNVVGAKTSIELRDDPNMPELEDIVYSDDDEDVGAEADMNNLDAFMHVSPIPTTRVHKDHPVEQIIRDLNSAPLTRRMTKNLEEHDRCYVGRASTIQITRSLDLGGFTKWQKGYSTKWVFKNKKDERGIMIKNKARLVTQGCTQEEGIDYDEVFAPVARIEAIRLFLAYSSFKDFVVYQMDVKSAFLYAKFEEEAYVCQPPGFEDLDFPDKTLFIKRDKGDILLVQVYVNDIIFGSTKKSLCTKFEKVMHKKFQMSSMGELTFFLGLQTASTPMDTQKPLLKYEDVCAGARYQVSLKVSHLHVVKRIFRYLKDQPKLGLWYLKDSPFDLVAYTDSDYAGASLDRKSTIGGCQFLRYALTVNPTICTSCIDHFWAIVKVKTVNEEQQLQALVDGKKIIITEATLTLIGAKTTAWNKFSSTMASAIICLATNKKFNFSKYIFESMVKNLDSAVKFLMYPRFVQVFLNNQLEGMATYNRIYIAPSHTKKIFANMRRQGKDFSGRVTPLFPTMVVQAQEEIGKGLAMPTDPHHIPIITQPSSSQPQRKQKSRRPKEKDTQIPQFSVPSDPINVADKVVTKEPTSLGDQEDASKQGRTIHGIDADEDITLDNVYDADMFKVNDLDCDVVVVESEVTNKAVPVSAATITNVELTLAQTLAELKSARPKTKGGQGSKDKGKDNMIEPEKPLKKKDQIKFNEEEALRLQAKFDEGDRLAREKAQQVKEANIAWDDIQAKIDADYQLAERLKKHFAAKRAEEKRNRPPTRAQQRNIMCTYLKNMARWKPKDLKNKSFALITEFIIKLSKKSKVMEESSSKRTRDELQQESTKKQKIDDDQERAELQSLMNVIPNEEEVAVDAIPLATKPPSIMLRSFDREDLETLWKLVKAKHGYSRPDEGYKRVLWGDLKTMFEHHIEDAVEKRYPLTPATIKDMLNKKLQADHRE
ncbi:putative ribonuclease H-like domain-containing protein [Tanacetum coccineum]